MSAKTFKLAVLFVDISGGPLAPEVDWTDQHIAILRVLSQSFRGRVFSVDAMQIMACFPDIDDACLAASSIQRQISEDAGRAAKIGVHCGLCLVKGASIFGDVVDEAATLMEMARPGQILLSQAIVDDALESTLVEVQALEDYAGQPLYQLAWREQSGSADYSTAEPAVDDRTRFDMERIQFDAEPEGSAPPGGPRPEAAVGNAAGPGVDADPHSAVPDPRAHVDPAVEKGAPFLKAHEEDALTGDPQQEELPAEASLQAGSPSAESLLEESLPEESLLEESLPEESLLEESLPEESLPEESLPEESLPDESLPEDNVAEEIPPGFLPELSSDGLSEDDSIAIDDALTLYPDSEPVSAPGPTLALYGADCVVEVRPGSEAFHIGRDGMISDWSFIKPVVSRMHLSIEYRDGDFVLLDTSTNGTYVSMKGREVHLQNSEIVLSGSGVISLAVAARTDPELMIRFDVLGE